MGRENAGGTQATDNRLEISDCLRWEEAMETRPKEERRRDERQDKTKQDKTRQDKTRQDKTRRTRYITRQPKTRQDIMEDSIRQGLYR
jgi:hypothetical protein